MVTDKLPSYGATQKKQGLTSHHDLGGRKNNRAENSHLPVRQRGWQMQRFRPPGSAQRFLSTCATVYNTFNVQRHLVSRMTLRKFRGEAMSATLLNVALPLLFKFTKRSSIELPAGGHFHFIDIFNFPRVFVGSKPGFDMSLQLCSERR